MARQASYGNAPITMKTKHQLGKTLEQKPKLGKIKTLMKYYQ